MATLPAMQDTDADPQMDPDQDADDVARDDAGDAAPDGGNPDQMIGYIDPQLPAKVRVFLKAAKAALLNEQGSTMLRKVLGGAQDHTKALALIVGKTIDKLETRLGPLTDQENDQVAFFITGWLVSSLQKMGMPGLDDAGARQDLIGRVLKTLDSSGQQPAQGAPPPGPPQPQPDQGGGTLPQLGGP